MFFLHVHFPSIFPCVFPAVFPPGAATLLGQGDSGSRAGAMFFMVFKQEQWGYFNMVV
jgi:hypothetical protein